MTDRLIPDGNRLKIALSGVAVALLFVGGGCASRSHQDATAAESRLGLSHEISPVTADSAENNEREDSAIAQEPLREPWEFAEAPGQLIRTPHYRLYTTIQNPRLLQQLPVFYEGALEQYTTALAKLPKPDAPLETFLFQSRSQWQVKTQEMLPDQAHMFSNLGRGGFTTKGTAVLYYIDGGGYSRDTLAIAAHEGWHQYTQRTFKHQLPIWLEEGVATYMEGYRSNGEGLFEFVPSSNHERRQTLRGAVRSATLIPLDELLTRTPQSVLNTSKQKLLIYYAQVWALTRFLAEGQEGRYREALGQVLTDAAHGKLVGRMTTSKVAPLRRRQTGGPSNHVGPAVAKEYFNSDLAEFEQQYLAFIEQLITQERRR